MHRSLGRRVRREVLFGWYWENVNGCSRLSGGLKGATHPYSTHIRTNVTIHEYFSYVWMSLNPKMEITYDTTAIMTMPTSIDKW